MVGISNVTERYDGYRATYTDRNGASCAVRGTFVFAPALSWYDESGEYLVVSGVDQGRLVATTAAEVAGS